MKEKRRFFILGGIALVMIAVFVSITLVNDYTKTRLIQRKEDEVKAYYTSLYFTGTGEGSAVAIDNNVGYVTFNLMNFIGEDVTERDIVYRISTPTKFYTNKNVEIPQDQEEGGFMTGAIAGTTNQIHVRDVWGQPKLVGRQTNRYEFEVVSNTAEEYTGDPVETLYCNESTKTEHTYENGVCSECQEKKPVYHLFSYEKLENNGSAHAVGKTHNVTLKLTRGNFDKIVGTENISVVVQLLKPYKEVYIINMTISERLIVFSNNTVTEFENEIEELNIQTADIFSHIYTKDSNGDYVSTERTISTPVLNDKGEQVKIDDVLQFIDKTISSAPLQVTLTWTNLIFNEVLASYLPNDVIIKTDLNSISSDSGSVTLLIPQGSDFKLQFYATKATYSVSAKVEIYDVDTDVKSYVIYDEFFGGYTNSEITIDSNDSDEAPDSILVLNETKQGLVH